MPVDNNLFSVQEVIVIQPNI